MNYQRIGMMNQIDVAAEDLERIRDVVAVSYNYHLMLDLQRQARDSQQQPTYSALTTELGEVRDRVEGLLKDALWREYDERGEADDPYEGLEFEPDPRDVDEPEEE